MKKSLSPKELDRICFEIQRIMSQADDLTRDISILLERVGDTEEGEFLQEAIYKAREIASTTLGHELYDLLYELRQDLSRQAKAEAEMKEVYAPPEFMGRFMEQPEQTATDEPEYPGNYSERPSSGEGGSSAEPTGNTGEKVRPANWEEGDTVGFCLQCKNSIPMKLDQCPYCGAIVRRRSPKDLLKEKLDQDAADMRVVYASPSVMRIRPAQALISRIRDKLSK